MEGFYKIPGALKIMLIELGAVFFFPVTVTGIITAIRPGIFPEYSTFVGVNDWLMALVGPIFMFWVLYDIFRPRVTDQVVGVGLYRVKFRFCSTHPSYVLIDALTIAFAAFFVWIGMTGGLAVALFFPAIRLSTWYLFGLKITGVETYDAYKPALWSFCTFAIIFGVAVIFGVLN